MKRNIGKMTIEYKATRVLVALQKREGLTISYNILHYRFMRTYKTVSVTFPPALLERALVIAEQEQRSMSELLREAFRTYERSRLKDAEDESETARRIKKAIGEERRGEYTDYDEDGLRTLGKSIIAKVAKEQAVRKRK